MSNENRSTVSVILIITTIMMYLFSRMYPGTFEELFILQSSSFAKGFAPWQLFTYAFYFPQNLVFFIFTVIAYMIMGFSLEHAWGSLKFGLFLLVLILSRSIPAFLFGVSSIEPVSGDWFIHLCLMVAFGFNFPEQEFRLYFFIPIKVKYLAIFALCCIPLYIFFPLYQYSKAFGLLTPGYIPLPVNVAFALVNGLSCVGILIFWKYIFFRPPVEQVVEKIRQNIQSIEDDNKRLLKIHGNKKYADLIADFTNHLEIDYSQFDTFDTRHASLCEADDFNREDPYCLECEKYPCCCKRAIDKTRGTLS